MRLFGEIVVAVMVSVSGRMGCVGSFGSAEGRSILYAKGGGIV